MGNKSDYEELLQRVKELEREREKRKAVEKDLLVSKQRYERHVNTIPCAI